VTVVDIDTDKLLLIIQFDVFENMSTTTFDQYREASCKLHNQMKVRTKVNVNKAHKSGNMYAANWTLSIVDKDTLLVHSLLKMFETKNLMMLRWQNEGCVKVKGMKRVKASSDTK